MEEEILKLKSFLSLVNLYLERFLNGHNLSNLVSQLDSETFLYEYYKDMGSEEDIEYLKNYMGFIESDEDVEENWYALAYAASIFLNTRKTGNKLIDSYILKMTKRD
ncbi:MAG: hypothetical protein J6J17_00590 [Bacilli bacterium]|nr:hypothetical protein [Bacilli bacterium]